MPERNQKGQFISASAINQRLADKLADHFKSNSCNQHGFTRLVSQADKDRADFKAAKRHSKSRSVDNIVEEAFIQSGYIQDIDAAKLR